ncbi:MAG: hypothetical protein ACEPOZ_05285 [Marinifilaceae bacterium]
MTKKGKNDFSVRVIKNSDVLNQDELVNVFGGVTSVADEQDCSCDCWIGNKNETKPTKPTDPTTK